MKIYNILGLTSLFLSSSNGIVLEDAPPSQMGVKVDRSFIAVASAISPEECTALRSDIENLKIRNEGELRFQQDGEIKAHKFSKARKCFINFKGDPETVAAVHAMKQINYVEQSTVFEAAVVEVQNDVDAKGLWGLNRIDQRDLPLSRGVPYSISHTGKGVNVYVLDTGILNTHEEFDNGRAIIGGDMINEEPLVDANGHGTHCAGTVGGKKYGVAKEATLIGVKVLDTEGKGTTETILGGIAWAVENANGKSGVITMSLSGTPTPAVDEAAKAAVEGGMILTTAAGNAQKDACERSPASMGGKGHVLTVASSTKTDGMSYFSNWGPCVDLYAPGSNVESAWVGSNTATKVASGTSMATPHVAGVAAALLEKHNFNSVAARAELLEITVPDKMKSTKGSPNRLLQAPQPPVPTAKPTQTRPPNASPPPTVSPTPKPTSSGCWWWCNSADAGEFGNEQVIEEQTSYGPYAVVGLSAVGLLCIGSAVYVYKKKNSAETAVVNNIEDQL